MIQISRCGGPDWEGLQEAEKDAAFERGVVDQDDFQLSASDLVGQDALIYRVNGCYYREADAWRAILAKKSFGIEPDVELEERTPTGMFRISSLGTPLTPDGKDAK